jgi:hypothetical protein
MPAALPLLDAPLSLELQFTVAADVLNRGGAAGAITSAPPQENCGSIRL